MTHFKSASITLLVLLALAVACSDSPSDPGPIETNEVSVQDNVFNPMTSLVAPGETVEWTWEGQNLHDVTWDTADLPDSPTQTDGTHQVTLPTEPGEYGYHCQVHGAPGQGMHGTVVVE